jgi:hypothetical protein
VLSGAIGVGLGFGLQKVVSNLVSGVIILLDKSIKPGDVISLGETFGWINALGARYVSITTRDGREYLIPNEDLITGQVVNWSHSNDFVRLDIFFGTAYGDDPHKAWIISCVSGFGTPLRGLRIFAAMSIWRSGTRFRRRASRFPFPSARFGCWTKPAKMGKIHAHLRVLRIARTGVH